MGFRIGLGHDTHRLVAGSFITLGGVQIPHEKSLLGHSDADVLLHATTDALLGAAGMGDIGLWFPDTDPALKGCDSAKLLCDVWEVVQKKGWSLGNLDCIVFAQRPKLAAFKVEIQENIARILAVTPDQVNVKAKTGESVGIIGREEAIAAECVALLSDERT